MFRFTIRELLLLTVIVGLGVGWSVRDRQHKVEIDGAQALARSWQFRAKAVADELRSQGCGVEFRDSGPFDSVGFTHPDGMREVVESNERAP